MQRIQFIWVRIAIVNWYNEKYIMTDEYEEHAEAARCKRRSADHIKDYVWRVSANEQHYVNIIKQRVAF